MARYVLQHPGETWLFNYQADPKTLYVYTDTDWAAEELTRKSVSCTVERYMLDCSVAKQSLVALSSGSERQSFTALSGPWRRQDATGGDHCIRQQCSTRNLHENRFGKRCDIFSIKELWIQEAYRKKEFQLVSVDTLLNWADTGTKAHTSERLTSLLRQMPLRLREGQTKALACHAVMNA